ncbi:LOW QUALITY PROTEIN: IQ domain-containing protein M [Pseudopipra pipra]|uniref:LOW QUALITY PROTEIN: IQ domain-containing protein M n=1 Tax=Pseudopipra pipra TaxID=415032 RepID=UPI00313A01AF
MPTLGTTKVLERPVIRALQQDFWLEKILNKLPERPLSLTVSSAFPEKPVKIYNACIYLSPQTTEDQEGERFFPFTYTLGRRERKQTPQRLKKISDKHLDLQTQKKNITQLEVFEASRDSRKHPSIREVLKAVICILRYMRRWFEHRALKIVKINSTSHGPSLPAAERYYSNITCIRCQTGVLDLSPPIWYFELEQWIDKKKFYETMFSQREVDKKMERNDLEVSGRACNDPLNVEQQQQLLCDLQRESLFGNLTTSTAAVRSIKKHRAFEMAFTLFPFLAPKLKNLITVLLPWVHHFMDEKDGSKILSKIFNSSEGY